MNVYVEYHQEHDGWWAESTTMDGFTAAGSSLAEVRELVVSGAPFYLNLETDDVCLFETMDSGAPVVDFQPLLNTRKLERTQPFGYAKVITQSVTTDVSPSVVEVV